MAAEIEKDSAQSTAVRADWLSAVARQDETALEKLYLATVDTVFALVSRILGNGPDAEEITEDVYLYVWQNASRYDPSQAHPVAWLVMLARSRAIDRYRHRVKHQRISDALYNEVSPEVSSDEPLALLNLSRLHDQLNALPQTPRQILAMAYFRGMTHVEIAEQLQMSLGTVKTHIRRTLIALRSDIED
ncbi:MAG: sigma-70 family RNA polymerase sigma factor [Pseudomonadota bacterium]